MARVEVLGVDQSFMWRLSGGATWLDAGNITGGSPNKISTGLIESNSIGGRQKRRLGRYGIEGSVEGDVLQETLTMLIAALACNAGGTQLMFGINTGHASYCHDPAVCSSFSIKGAVDSPLQFSLAWVAEHLTATALVNPAVPTNDILTDYDMDVKLDGAALVCRSFNMSVDYKATMGAGGIRKGTALTKRLKSGGMLFNSTPTVEIDVELEVAPTAANYLGDCPDEVSFVVDIHDSCSANVATITATNMIWQVDDASSFEGDSAGVVLWKGKLVQLTSVAPTIALT
jgi:hypothetical protein